MTAPEVPLKFVVRMNQRELPGSTNPDFEFRYLDIGSVGTGQLIADPVTVTFGEAPSRARRLVGGDDTIVSTVRTYLRAVWPVTDFEVGLVVSTGFAVLSPGPDLNPRFLGWWAQGDSFIEEIVARSTGVTYPAINPSDLGRIEIPLWPMDSQRAIADFLDLETTRIDGLIAKKLRMIDLVEERYLEVVRLSTRPELSLDDPEPNWKPYRLKHLTQIQRGRSTHRPRNDPVLYDGPYPFLQTGDITSASRYIDSFKQTLNEFGQNQSRSFPPGTILMAIAANVGDIAITTFEAWCPDSVVAFLASPAVDVEYLYFLLLAVRKEINETSTENTQENTNIERLGNLRVFLPPLAEQAAIVERLNAAEGDTRTMTARLRRSTELLRERRHALITAAVTGTLPIPGVAA